jgi:hypothetical protein
MAGADPTNCCYAARVLAVNRTEAAAVALRKVGRIAFMQWGPQRADHAIDFVDPAITRFLQMGRSLAA